MQGRGVREVWLVLLVWALGRPGEGCTPELAGYLSHVTIARDDSLTLGRNGGGHRRQAPFPTRP